MPFVGPAGYELDRMLGLAGLNRSSILITNVCNEQPPPRTLGTKIVKNDLEQFFYKKSEAKLLALPEVMGRFPKDPIMNGRAALLDLLGRYPRRVILAMGDTALWALTGHTGIMKWRASHIQTSLGTVIPTIHPATLLYEGQWPLRPILINDLRRAAGELRSPMPPPPYAWMVRPKLWHVTQRLHWLRSRALPISVDIETRNGQIACLGLAWSRTDALCIPFTCVEGDRSYWTADEESRITSDLQLTLQSLPCIFHNGQYDCQYIAKQWGYLPTYEHDTMLMQHVLFPGLLGGKIDPITGETTKKGSSLSLLFISSMYCAYHRYWKDDGRNWDPAIHPEDQFWSYNCEDCVRTYECWEVLTGALAQVHLTDQYDFERSLLPTTLRMMFRGVRIDPDKRAAMHHWVQSARAAHEDWIQRAIGHPFNPSSNPQMLALFYEDLGLPVILNRKTKSPSLDDDALTLLAKRHPLLRPLITHIQDWRTLGVLDSNILSATISPDGRMRCSLNVAGPETFRYSSNTTAFGEGCNLQTVPKPYKENE